MTQSFDTSYINKKNVAPVDPLIFQTAADFAAVWFDTARSSGMPAGKYVGRGDKPIKMFVADNLEKFIPLAISILIDMLKPTSNCNDIMRDRIFKAITNPVNDPDLMLLGKKPRAENEKMIVDAIRNFDKNKLGFINTKPVTKSDLNSTTVLKNG